MSTKRALIDVDGVCADFDAHTLALLGSNLTTADLTSRVDAAPGINKKALRELWTLPEFWLTLPVMEDAEWGLKELLARGYEVVFLSAPYDSCQTWLSARQAWLKIHFPFIPRANFIACPGRWKHAVSGSLLYEDTAKNLLPWKDSQGGKAFLYPHPSNANEASVPRVRWKEMLVYA